jgi:hypothetical protein
MRMDRPRLAALLIFTSVLVGGLLLTMPSEDFPSLTGMATARLQVVDIYALVCNFTVSTGWNLISVPCFEDTPSVSYGLESLYMNVTNVTTYQLPNGSTYEANTTWLVALYDSIHTFDTTDPVDPWGGFQDSLPNYVVIDLNNLTHEKGYFLNMKSDSRLVYYGRVSLPNFLDLYDGLDLVGFPVNDTEHTKPIDISITTINNTLTNIYQLVSGSWEHYNATTQDFVNFTPYRGYWFVMIDNDTWVIDW